MAWWCVAALLSLLCVGRCLSIQPYANFSSATIINTVAQDPHTGRIYLGAVNAIYQLDAQLQKESIAVTGPKKDNPSCTPPITATCTEARDTNNYNKLLLTNPKNGSLVVCGSIYRGICSLLNLSHVEQQIYYSDVKGEKTYVATTDENVSVVGIISTLKKGDEYLSVFVVGKGYGGSDSSKLISTRLLQVHGDMDMFENVVEASMVQASPFALRYHHDFHYIFKDSGYIYFLFTRIHGTTNITMVARLCENDTHYYSYTELQLNCTTPGSALVKNLSSPSIYGALNASDKVLFAVFSQDGDATSSALCMYSLRSINLRLKEVIERDTLVSSATNNKPEEDNSLLQHLCLYAQQENIMEKYPCGEEFLPSPLASKPEYALTVSPVFTRKSMLTAVAVAVENEHTVAFLGTRQGEVFKVRCFLLRCGFGSLLQSGVPVQACEQKTNCTSCVNQLDPYCGWCVLEGRCTRKKDCSRGGEQNAWLWSPNQQCVAIQAFHPPNISCKKTQQVMIGVRKALLPHHASPPPPLSSNFNVCLCRCIDCVTSQWGCQWNTQEHTCMALYNCSVGREDCSLCKNADRKYNCVWCQTTSSCIYSKLCPSEATQCPSPSITDIVPRYGPKKGHIMVTIKGSNLGIKKEDITRITVAGVPCTHKPERYSVSTRYYIHKHLHSPFHFKPFSTKGAVEVEVEGSKMGVSEVAFEYRDPAPESVEPTRGPADGGTVITISGRNLDTATKDDISIVVGAVPLMFSFAQAFVGNEPCNVTILQADKLILVAPFHRPKARSRRQRRETSSEDMELIKFGHGEWNVGFVHYEKKNEVPLYIIIPAVILPMVLFIAVSVYCYRRKSQQAEREYEKVKQQLESLEESVRDRCKKEFTDLMIEMEDHTSDLSEARIPFLDYKNYTDRVFFLPSKDGANDVMITGKLDIPENRRATVEQALNQFSNLLNSKTFLINFIRTLESRQEFNARNKVYFASLLTVALHGKLEYYTDIMRTLLLELMEEYVQSKNPKLMLRRSETVVERMLCNWMSISLYQFLKDSAGEPLYKLFKAIKHQVEKGPVDAKMKKAKYTLNDTGLLGDDVEYSVLTLQVLVHGEGPDVTPVKVLNCDTISQVKEKIIEQVYRNLPYSQRPTVESVALEWRPGSTGQILSDLDLTSQKEGRWKRLNTLAHYNVRDNATLVLSRVLHTQQSFDQNQDSHEEKSALLEDDKVFHLVRPADELDEVKSKRGSMKDKATTKAITEIYLTRLLSMKGTLQQFVDDFFSSVLCSGTVVPPAVKYFFDFLDEQAHKHDNVDEETIHIWKTNSLPLRFWVNILKNPHFIFDVHVTEVVDASLSVIAQTFMDACTKTEHKLSRESPSNKLLYAKEISTYKKMVDDYYKGIRQMVPVSDQDMNTYLAEISRSHTEKLNTQVALHQLYQYASKYYDGIISSLEEDPAAQNKQLTLRLQQIAAALENKVTDL
uniref:Sema domain-containing protein n=1 Tax=Pygocentrus nattereri TaxID=42514 RepID=A0AAR2LE23_PYGNA